MSQDKILVYLYNKRLEDAEEYFSVCKIERDLKGVVNTQSIRKKIAKLFFYGFIEAKTFKGNGFFSDGKAWRRGFRLKKKYEEKIKSLIEEEHILS